MIESTFERIKRLNSEGKHTIIKASDEWWQLAACYIARSCEEVFECTTEELTDFQIGATVGAAQSAYEFAIKQRGGKQ